MNDIILPIAGGAILLIGMAYVIKAIIKIALFAIGGMALFLGILQYEGWITVNWRMIEYQSQIAMNELLSFLNHAGTQIH